MRLMSAGSVGYNLWRSSIHRFIDILRMILSSESALSNSSGTSLSSSLSSSADCAFLPRWMVPTLHSIAAGSLPPLNLNAANA